MGSANRAALAFSYSAPELDEELIGNKSFLRPLLRRGCNCERSQAEKERG